MPIVPYARDIESNQGAGETPLVTALSMLKPNLNR